MTPETNFNEPALEQAMAEIRDDASRKSRKLSRPAPWSTSGAATIFKP
jgi:hypothetical protein